MMSCAPRSWAVLLLGLVVAWSLTQSAHAQPMLHEYIAPQAAEDVKRLTGEVIPTSARSKRMFTFRRPVGVWAAITPWNFPVTIPLEYVGPGLATGNAVIVKPPI